MVDLLFQSRQERLSDNSALLITKVIGAIESTTAHQFEDKINAFFSQGARHLILVLSDLRYINSTGMGLLVKLGDKFHDNGGSLRLVDVPEKMTSLLKSLGLLSAFKIYKNEEEAIEAIGKGGVVKGQGHAKKSGPDLSLMAERTLLLLKPDAVERGLVGEIISRFEKKGLKLAGLKLLKMTEEMAAKHYHEHRDKPFYPGLAQFMTSQPIVAMAIEGIGAVAICRKMTGATFGAQAEPGTIRGDYGISTSYNLIHSSADRESAVRELPIFFSGNELFNYTRVLDGWIATEEDAKKLNK